MALNVGIITEYYYPLLGGISENVHHTATELIRQGHRATIITSVPSDIGRSPIAVPNGVPVVHIGRSIGILSNGAVAHATLGSVHVWHSLRHAVDRERFDILQLHSPLNPTLPPLATLQGLVPKVGTFHSYFDESRVYGMLKGVLQRVFLKRLKGITVVSPSVQLALSRYFQMNPRVIPNGVDMTQFHAGVPRLEQFGTDKRTLLFLGRFDPRNGLPFMLRSFERVRRQMDDVRLVIVGSGGHPAEYERMIPPALRADVHFEGPALLDRPRYYATADVFCSPISKASFGITLLESMATGTPIVATENIGYRDLLGPEEGVLVRYDAGAFADAIVALLRDDRRRAAMGVAGRAKAAQYAWPRVVASLLDYFHEILSAC